MTFADVKNPPVGGSRLYQEGPAPEDYQNAKLEPKTRRVRDMYGKNAIGDQKDVEIYSANPEVEAEPPTKTDWKDRKTDNKYSNIQRPGTNLDQHYPGKKKQFELSHAQSKEMTGNNEKQHPNPLTTKEQEPVRIIAKPVLDNSNEERRRKDHRFSDLLSAKQFPPNQTITGRPPGT